MGEGNPVGRYLDPGRLGALGRFDRYLGKVSEELSLIFKVQDMATRAGLHVK